MGETQSQEPVNEMLCGQIHTAIHTSYLNEVTINGQVYPIQTYKNGCRFVEYGGITFMEQNINKSSKYAAKARAGYHITWGMRPGDWIYMESEFNSKTITIALTGMKKEY